jgi:hypothetical protein
MKIMVLLADENNKINEDYDFVHDFPEMPQVGDTIELLGNEIDEKWFPYLQRVSEYFTVLQRGWRVPEAETTSSPFIVVKNNGIKNPF